MNHIGINTELATTHSEQFNTLLANYQVFHANLRGFHWNIKGENFFELHLKFEELYNDIQLKIDQIAERILTLGGTPEYRYSVYLNLSDIKEAKDTQNGKESVNNILETFRIILHKQRQLKKLCDETEDEGSSALMSDYIREQEKLVWMYNAYLK